MPAHPLVSPWMLHDGAGVRATGDRLRELAALLGRVEVTVASTLGSAVTALGWQGQVTDRAEEAASTTRTMLTRLADCCEAAGSALLELSAAMSWHGPRLVELLAEGPDDSGPGPRLGSPGGPTPIFGADPRDPVVGLPVQPGDSAGAGLPSGLGGPAVEPWRELLPVDDDRERLIRQHVDDLEAQDQRCHDRLAHVRDDLEAMFPHGTAPEFLRSLVPSQVWRELVASGIIRHTLPIRGDRVLLDPRQVGPIRRTLPIRRELRPGCFRVVPPPVRHTLPIHEDIRTGDFRTEPPVRHTLPIHEDIRPGEFRTEPPVRHTLPIPEERTVLRGADVDPGPVPTVEAADR
ncbi:hypothetical protein [Ornithinimicrobium sufpigmenti]|uniref:hypothetical protein n=1 Tax=Ornithinimicrobium sufpigmenti TaxID=2508882 RepID=UPI001036DB4D|nr:MULTISPECIES: hypothetical protein [unclassified Ornithinimicrobium]